MDKVYSVGIIGGGVSGSVVALQLAENGIDNILFEKEDSLVNGPPFCHLHAGGNLYPEISEEECRLLMKQSIEMARLFPQSIDERPTLFSIPKKTKYKPSDIEARLNMLSSYYLSLINEDPENQILGLPQEYFKKYIKEDLISLKNQKTYTDPKTLDEWMCNVVNLIDLEQIKTPVFMVQEYGWNLFRLAAQAQLALSETTKSKLCLKTKVLKVIDCRNNDLDYNWEIHTKDSVCKIKYLVNASGFRSVKIDKGIAQSNKRIIEFKAAYVSKWKDLSGPLPELIFHGERGTSKGMAQLTPYSGGFYQIHGMTKEITLFDDGLIKVDSSSKFQFTKNISDKIKNNWDEKELNNRTEKAIRFVAGFIPSFESAEIGGPALCGAQQVIGDDLNLRVAEVSFPSEAYARCEIIKASSALTVANKIIINLQEENVIPFFLRKQKDNSLLSNVTTREIDEMAEKLTVERSYPRSLSCLLVEKK